MKNNSYQMALSQEFYNSCPKAVFAAIAVSLATNGGDYIEEAQSRVCDEWHALYANGIVNQKPPKEAI